MRQSPPLQCGKFTTLKTINKKKVIKFIINMKVFELFKMGLDVTASQSALLWLSACP